MPRMPGAGSWQRDLVLSAGFALCVAAVMSNRFPDAAKKPTPAPAANVAGSGQESAAK